jgi:two-component sensor histidine kinase
LIPVSPTDIDSQQGFRTEVASRFGLVPNFFQTAGDAPGLISELWGFAKSAYLDNPLPSVFKERLFVHLSRFCDVRYCIVRHVGFLIGAGNPAGDPKASPETVVQVVELLRRPALPEGDALSASLDRLASYVRPVVTMPESGSAAEWDIFAAASLLFLSPAQSDRARAALRTALGGPTLEILTAYLAFIRMAHYWTQTHPELLFEEDMERLMRQHEELAKLLLDESDGERSHIGTRLFEELETLRAEKDDRVALRMALARNEEAQRHQRLLINELNHRVKNTLSIIKSIAMQTLRDDDVPPALREAFVASLLALADAHDILTAENWDGAELGEVLARAVDIYRQDGNTDRVSLKGPAIRLEPKSAIAFAMAVHELATNAAKYGALSREGGCIDLVWDLTGPFDATTLRVRWTERGGPRVIPPTKKGFGSRLIERGLAGELNGSAKIDYKVDGVVCTIEAPFNAPAPAS